MIFTVIRENEEHLEHADRKNHKYIKKYKSKSGKWVYVYADKLKSKIGINQKDALEKAQYDYDLAEWVDDATTREQQEKEEFIKSLQSKGYSGDYIQKITGQKETKKNDPDIASIKAAKLYLQSESFMGSTTNKQTAAKNKVHAKNQLDKAKYEYSKTPLAKAEKVKKSVSEKAASAKSKIQNTINNLNKKKKKKATTNSVPQGRQKNLSGKTATVGKKGSGLGTGKVRR